MNRLVLGVIGHVDHGKTALVRALTGADTDRLPEEKRRGISIALGFAHLKLQSGVDVDLIDMPGHENFVRTMISGATGMDAVLLVVAANEGIKAQTREHVDIAGLLGLRRAVIAVSKTDLVSPDEARRVGDDAALLLRRAGFTPLPPVGTAALKESGIVELRAALAELAAEQEPRRADGVAYLPIDRAFTMAGRGPVVTGTLRGGPIKFGDTLELLPTRQKARVREVQVHGEKVEAAEPGRRVALNLRDVEIDDLKSAAAVAIPNALPSSTWLTISIRAVADAPPLKNGMRLCALLGATEHGVRLRLLDRDVLAPGESGFAQLNCADPVATPAREHVILRIASPAQTVAGGRVLDTAPERLKRHNGAVQEQLAALHDRGAEDIVDNEIERARLNGVTLERLAQLSALAPAHVSARLKARPVVVTPAGVVIGVADLEALRARLVDLVTARSGGLTQEQLLAAAPGVSAAVLEGAIAALITSHVIAKRGASFLIPRPDDDRARARGEAELAARIAETLRLGGLSPPDPRAIAVDPASRRAIDRLLRETVIVQAVDRAKDKEILFHRDAIDEARRILAPLLERTPGLLVSEIGAALGISRKYTMPLLDHLDSIRFTRRINDRRILGAKTPSVR